MCAVWAESPSLPDPCRGIIWSLLGPSELALSRQFVGGKWGSLACLLAPWALLLQGRAHGILPYLPYFPGGSAGKESTCNAGDPGLIRSSGRSPREGNGNPLQYFCLGNPMDRGTWWATVHVVARVTHDLQLNHYHLYLPQLTVWTCLSLLCLFLPTSRYHRSWSPGIVLPLHPSFRPGTGHRTGLSDRQSLFPFQGMNPNSAALSSFYN